MASTLPGATVYVTADLSGYLGRFTVRTIEADGNLVVTDSSRRARVRPDQCYSTRKAALAATATPNSAGWASAAQLGRTAK